MVFYLSHEQNSLVNWLRKRGFDPTWFTGDYDGPHSRETYQPTSIMRWDRGIFNGSYAFIVPMKTLNVPSQSKRMGIVERLTTRAGNRNLRLARARRPAWGWRNWIWGWLKICLFVPNKIGIWTSMSNSYFGGYHCINVTSQKQRWRHPEGGILACTSRVSAEASETQGTQNGWLTPW